VISRALGGDFFLRLASSLLVKSDKSQLYLMERLASSCVIEVVCNILASVGKAKALVSCVRRPMRRNPYQES
jgi:hypothetical protein